MPVATGTIIAGVGAAAGLASAGVGVANAIDSGNKAGDQAKSQADAAAQAQQAATQGAKNLQPAVDAQQNLANQLAAQGGIANQSQVYNQTQQLAQNGSALAGAQLTGATNQGIQQATGTIASAKGLNPALAARLAGQQAAQSGQTAANQSAQMQAQVQMNALGQAANISGQQVGNQMAGQGAATQAVMNQQQMAQGMALGQQQNANAAGNTAYGNQGASAQAGAALGGLGTALGTAGTVGANMFPAAPRAERQPPPQTQTVTNEERAGMGMHKGGKVPDPKAPKSYVSHHFMGGMATPTDGKDKLRLALGGKVPAMVSPGEIYLPPAQAVAVAKGVASPMQGEVIPGKAKVKGDSLKNDIVPKTLEEGGVVIPRSVLDGPNAHREAYKFVNAALGKAAMKRKSK